jgi:hypothetical protein
MIGTSHLPDRKMSRPIPSAGKVMPTLYYERRGSLQIDRLSKGITVNADRYGKPWSV